MTIAILILAGVICLLVIASSNQVNLALKGHGSGYSGALGGLTLICLLAVAIAVLAVIALATGGR